MQDWLKIIKENLPEGSEIGEDVLNSLAKLVDEKTKGLADNKNEILAKLAKQKQQNDELLEKLKKFDNFNIDDYNKLKENLLKGNIKEGDITTERFVNLQLAHDKLINQVKDLESKNAETSEKYNGLHNRYIDTEIRSQITKSLKDAGVSDTFNETLYLANKSLAKGVLDGDKIKIVMGDSEKMLEVNEWVKDWSKSETAKAFMKAPINSGGGSAGDGGANGSSNDEDPLFDKNAFH